MGRLTEKQVVEIINLCAEDKMKHKDIAKLYNLSPSSFTDIVSRRSWKHIERPNLNKETKRQNLPKLTSRQLDIINGSLLGDGSLKEGNKNACFSKNQCAANLEYLEWHNLELMPYSSSIGKIKSKKIIHDENRKIIGYSTEKYYEGYCYSSIHHTIFTEMFNKWYKNINDKNIKIVPCDLVLTPLMLSVWFCDDGFNTSKYRRSGYCTNGFTKEEVEFLNSQLNEIFNIKSNIYFDSSGPMIYIESRSYIDFQNIISPHITCNCVKYKTDTSQYTEPQKYCKSDIPGVRQAGKSWYVYMTYNNKSKYLGSFDNKDDAIKCRKEAEEERLKSGDCPRQFLSYTTKTNDNT